MPLLAAALGACVAAPASAFHGMHSHPVTGACDTRFVLEPSGTIVIEGRCHFSVVGEAAVAATQTVTPMPDDPTRMLITTNTAYTFTADGSVLESKVLAIGAWVVAPGSSSPSGVTFGGIEQYLAGTGIVTGTLGQAAVVGQATFDSPVSGTGRYTFVGNFGLCLSGADPRQSSFEDAPYATPVGFSCE